MMNSEKGQALPLALIALAVGSLVIAPFLGHASSMLTGSRIYGQAITEQYSCDAGVELAIWHLQSGTSEVPEGGELELLEFTINNKTVNVTIEGEGGQIYKITSTATSANGSSTTIESYVRLLHYAIASTETNSLITIRQRVVINGDIYSAGELEIIDDATVNGEIIEGDPFDIGIDLEEYKAGAQSGGTHNGNLIINTSPYALGPLYITGKLQIQKEMNIILGGTVYVEGNIEIKDDVTITGTGNLICENQGDEGKSIEINEGVTISLENIPLIMCVYSTKEVKIGDGSNITGVIYAPNGRVHFHAKGPESHVHGTLIGKNVRVCEDATVTSNPALHLWVPNALQILTWEVE